MCFTMLLKLRSFGNHSLPARPARPLAPFEMSVGPCLCNLASLGIAPASALAAAMTPFVAPLLDLHLVAENFLPALSSHVASVALSSAATATVAAPWFFSRRTAAVDLNLAQRQVVAALETHLHRRGTLIVAVDCVPPGCPTDAAASTARRDAEPTFTAGQEQRAQPPRATSSQCCATTGAAPRGPSR